MIDSAGLCSLVSQPTKVGGGGVVLCVNEGTSSNSVELVWEVFVVKQVAYWLNSLDLFRGWSELSKCNLSSNYYYSPYYTLLEWFSSYSICFKTFSNFPYNEWKICASIHSRCTIREQRQKRALKMTCYVCVLVCLCVRMNEWMNEWTGQTTTTSSRHSLEFRWNEEIYWLRIAD